MFRGARRRGIVLALRTDMPLPNPRDAERIPPLAGLRVLVVEDRRELRELLALMLVDDGVDVAQAGTAREAIAAASIGAPFDAILTDLGLPDAPGELLIRYVASRGRPRPLIIVISADDHARFARAEAAGADVLLEKPVDWDRVEGHLRALRALRRLRSA